jgi:hypothetical protein
MASRPPLARDGASGSSRDASGSGGLEHEFNIHYADGLVGSSSGEEEIYSLDDVPDEARQLCYTETSAGPDALDYEVQMALATLKQGGQ